MDAFDIFRKLTAGAQFTKKKNHQSSAQAQNLIKHPKNKKETKNDNELDIDDQVNSQKDDEFNSDIDIKQESEEEEEDYNVHDDDDKEKPSFQILSEKTLEDLPKKRKRSKSDNGSQPKKKMNKEAEEINQLRNSHRIKVYGKNVPAPIQTFDELHSNYNVSVKIIDNLAKCGFPLPTPIQMQALPIMLQGKSLMACAPTGSGKTVAFLAPIIRDLNGPQKNGFRAIILCPTRELAKQIQRECLRLTENIGLKVHILSKMKQAEQMYGPKSNKKYDILISTPKRVCYLLNQEPPLLDLKNIEWFIIDEADKLMEDGVNSFKDQLEQILDACTKPSKKIALFSATYTVPVAKWAIKNLKGLIRVTIGEQNSATDTVKQELLFVGSESGKLLAFRDLIKNGVQPPVLVFVQTKDRAKQLFQELIYDGINVDVIHADRTQQQRDNVVKAFREGKIWILICTELMGRGIDFKGVNLVINYDFPPTVISYIHRIGRTGRAGRPGRSITYFTQDDRVNLRSVAQIIKNSGGNVPDFMLKLKKPKKSDRKLLAKKPLDREDISTKLKFDMKSNKKRKGKDQLQNQDGKSVKVKTSASEDMKMENLKKKKKINFVKINKK